jgi:acetyltransferase-like isoleucine patch superfamily enzyme
MHCRSVIIWRTMSNERYVDQKRNLSHKKERLNDVSQDLEQLYLSLRGNMRTRWDRDLPFEELLFDRWERAISLGFGDETSVYHNSYVYGNVKVGEHTWIGPYTILDGSGNLTIGSYSSISAGVHIYTHDTVEWAVSGGKSNYKHAPVEIGDCCYIGSQTVITKGVNVGRQSVIGACSFLNRDIPPNSIAVGAPCRVIGKVIVDEQGKVNFDYF